MQPDWYRAFLHLTREPNFSRIWSFNRIIMIIMVHDLNPKNLHINRLLSVKSKRPCFLVVFGHYPQNETFPKKSGSVSFLPLRQPNLRQPNKMRSFRKVWWVVLKKMRLPTGILTYWKWMKSYDPFSPKGGCPVITIIRLTYFNPMFRFCIKGFPKVLPDGFRGYRIKTLD